MNEREILDKLSCDISEIELPPISENVLQALREKNENCGKTNENHIKPVKTHKKLSRKYVFAAIIAFFIISLPIIVVISNNNTNPVITEESQISNNSKSDVSKSDTPNETNNPSVLEKIKLKEVYGTVALTKRPEEECELYLMNYDPDNSIYEDDNYLYNFDSDGNLIEILNTKDVYGGRSRFDENAIKEKTEALISLYFPQLTEEKCDFNIQRYKSFTPAWTVNINNKDKDVVDSRLFMTFDEFGNLYMAVFSPETNDVGNVSKMQAVDIALEEIKSGKYDISKFERKDVDIKLQKKDGIYTVSVDNIPTKEIDFMLYYVIKIDSNSGKIISKDIMK